jgi:integrase
MTDTTDDAAKLPVPVLAPKRRTKFTDNSIINRKDFRPGTRRRIVRHPFKLGHYIIVQKAKPRGGAPVRTFVVQARDGFTGKQVWHTVGRCDRMSVEAAALAGDEAIARIKQGKPPVEPPKPPADTVQALSTAWLEHYVVKKGLRTRREIERKLNVYILPRIGERTFEELQRSDIAKLLDTVAEENGERMADAVYTVLMSIAHWHAGRSNYVVAYDNIPKHSETPARDRVLHHAELRTIWQLASAPDAGVFGAIVRLALLTGQRREKIVGMRHGDILNGRGIDEVIDRVACRTVYDGVWRIPTEDREKGNGEELLLPQAALDIIAAQPRFASNDYVFPAAWGGGPVNNLHLRKRTFDAKLAAGHPDFAPWRVHDLRRTSRTLMSEIGIDREIAERILGHRLGKIEGTYDRHAPFKRKGEALAALAEHIEIIVAGPAHSARKSA